MPSAEPSEGGRPVEPDIRFTLANERTFLAWLRTAIGLVAAGVAVFHLLAETPSTTILALVLLASGGLAGVAGFLHFQKADHAIRSGDPMPTNTSVITVMTGVVLLGVAVGIASVLL